MLYFTKKHIKYLKYLFETKEENSGNIFLITVNENLYFKIWSPFQPPPQKVILYYSYNNIFILRGVGGGAGGGGGWWGGNLPLYFFWKMESQLPIPF